MYMATGMQFIFILAVFLAGSGEKAPDYVWLLQRGDGEREPPIMCGFYREAMGRERERDRERERAKEREGV